MTAVWKNIYMNRSQEKNQLGLLFQVRYPLISISYLTTGLEIKQTKGGRERQQNELKLIYYPQISYSCMGSLYVHIIFLKACKQIMLDIQIITIHTKEDSSMLN